MERKIRIPYVFGCSSAWDTSGQLLQPTAPVICVPPIVE